MSEGLKGQTAEVAMASRGHRGGRDLLAPLSATPSCLLEAAESVFVHRVPGRVSESLQVHLRKHRRQMAGDTTPSAVPLCLG